MMPGRVEEKSPPRKHYSSHSSARHHSAVAARSASKDRRSADRSGYREEKTVSFQHSQQQNYTHNGQDENREEEDADRHHKSLTKQSIHALLH
jgi:hypothetical protein